MQCAECCCKFPSVWWVCLPTQLPCSVGRRTTYWQGERTRGYSPLFVLTLSPLWVWLEYFTFINSIDLISSIYMYLFPSLSVNVEKESTSLCSSQFLSFCAFLWNSYEISVMLLFLVYSMCFTCHSLAGQDRRRLGVYSTWQSCHFGNTGCLQIAECEKCQELRWMGVPAAIWSHGTQGWKRVSFWWLFAIRVPHNWTSSSSHESVLFLSNSFRTDLQHVSRMIKQRNDQRDAIYKYPYLDPEILPNNIYV